MSRENMPACAGFIDTLRDVFGADEINNVIRCGLRPDCQPDQRFFAKEAGHVLGLRYVPSGTVVSGDQMLLSVAKEDWVVEPPKRGRKR